MMNNLSVSQVNHYLLIATADVSIIDPAHHVKVLGKHFASKVQVDFKKNSTLVIFEEGSCNMIPHHSNIEFHCRADNKADMKDITDTIDRHINAFFRKKNFDIDWDYQNNKSTGELSSRG